MDPLHPESPKMAQTWTHNVFVPLTQNLIGGAAVCGLCWLATSAWIGEIPSPAALRICLFMGGAVACLVTIVRFFGDDLGMVWAAYRAGHRQAELRIHTLEVELQKAREVANTQPVHREEHAKWAQELKRTHHHAQDLIEWHFQGLPIDRRHCNARGLSQRPWERARKLLVGAGVMDSSGITARSTAEAQRLMDVYCKRLLSMGGKQQNYVTPV